MYEVIGVSEATMDKGRPESLLSNLVAEVLRLSADRVLKHSADIGIMNMGGLRNILPQGDITVDAVFEKYFLLKILSVCTDNEGYGNEKD